MDRRIENLPSPGAVINASPRLARAAPVPLPESEVGEHTGNHWTKRTGM
jgi:hypothetical protein